MISKSSKLCVVVTLTSLVLAPACVSNRTQVKSFQGKPARVKYKPNRPRKSNGLMSKATKQACGAFAALVGSGVAFLAGCVSSVAIIPVQYGGPVFFWNPIGISFFIGSGALCGLSGFLGYKSFKNFKEARALRKQEQPAIVSVQPELVGA